MDRVKKPRYVVEVARNLRKGQTTAEQLLWARLRNRRLEGAKFRRQYPIGRYVADFYCNDSNLAIELEGSIHQEQAQIEYDSVRLDALEGLGVWVLRLKNEEISGNLEGVLERIRAALANPNSPLSLWERGRGEDKP